MICDTQDELATRAGQVVLVSRALQVPQATLEGQVGLVQEVHPALDGVLPLHWVAIPASDIIT